MKLILNNLKNYQLPKSTLQSKKDDDREDMLQGVQKRVPVSILMKNYTFIFLS